MNRIEKIKYEAERISSYITEVRRSLHMCPEPGMEEWETSEFIKKELEKNKIKTQSMCGSGIAAVISGKYPGKTLLYRADMDALPIQEETKLSYASRNPGQMHACGHDIHMACAVGTAILVNRMKNELHGNLKIMFQPCEEKQPGGAEGMLAEGILDDPVVDAACAIHVCPDYVSGTFGVSEGIVTSSPSWFEVYVLGRGGHASEPEKCIHPMDAAVEIYTKFQKFAREYQGEDKTVICTTILQGGNAQNIIPDTCRLAGTVRTYSDRDTRVIKNKLEEICRETENSTEAKCRISYRTSMNPIYNSSELAALMRGTISEVHGTSAFPKEPVLFRGGEDFAFIADRVPALLMFAGCARRDEKKSFPLHNARFCPDENMIVPTIEVMTEFVFRYLDDARVERSESNGD